MPEQTWSPKPGAPVVEYRSSWWGFIGGLAMFVLAELVALFPEAGNRSSTPRMAHFSPTAASLIFGALAVVGLMFMVGSIPRMHRFAVDERGLWWRTGRRSGLIAWEELRAVRGQESRPPVKGDPNSKAVRSALVFTPADDRFATRHASLVKGPPTAGPEVELRLPNIATVRQLAADIATVRPDLLR